MKIGYSFWGFLGDKKLGKNHEQLSTPDGNAFYSWAIIHDLIKNGHEVVKVMPDRDKPGYEVYGPELFASFAKEKRDKAYRASSSIQYPEDMSPMTPGDYYELWDALRLYECDLMLVEWRMYIVGRNDTLSKDHGKDWQPDWFLQTCLLMYCEEKNIPVTVFDLDYKLDVDSAKMLASKIKNFRIFELGDKWSTEVKGLPAETVAIPFDFSEIYTYKPTARSKIKLVYIGNRYERDWCVDKYMPKGIDGVEVYGNWLEGGRDSAARWPGISFNHRVDASEMPQIYQGAATTILFAKEEYCKHHFMTARLLEAAFYGVVPLFIEEYGDEYIKELVGPLAHVLVVRSEDDVIKAMNNFAANPRGKIWVVNSLREELRATFDVSNFTSALLSKPKKRWKRTSRKTAFEHMKEDTFKPNEYWNAQF